MRPRVAFVTPIVRRAGPISESTLSEAVVSSRYNELVKIEPSMARLNKAVVHELIRANPNVQAEGLADIGRSLWGGAKKIGSAAVDAAKGVGSAVKKDYGEFKDRASAAAARVGEMANKATDKVSDVAKSAAGAAKQGLQDIKAGAGETWKGVKDAATGAAHDIKAGAAKRLGDAKAGLQKDWDKTVQHGAAAYDAVGAAKDKAVGAAKAGAQAIADAPGKAAAGAANLAAKGAYKAGKALGNTRVGKEFKKGLAGEGRSRGKAILESRARGTRSTMRHANVDVIKGNAPKQNGVVSHKRTKYKLK